jgi:hypothetical protein
VLLSKVKAINVNKVVNVVNSSSRERAAETAELSRVGAISRLPKGYRKALRVVSIEISRAPKKAQR